jgi:hypothetical protein
MRFDCSNRQDKIESNTRANQRLQPTAFGTGMRGVSCQQSLWLLKRVLTESAAAEPQTVRRFKNITKGKMQTKQFAR